MISVGVVESTYVLMNVDKRIDLLLHTFLYFELIFLDSALERKHFQGKENGNVQCAQHNCIF